MVCYYVIEIFIMSIFSTFVEFKNKNVLGYLLFVYNQLLDSRARIRVLTKKKLGARRKIEKVL